MKNLFLIILFLFSLNACYQKKSESMPFEKNTYGYDKAFLNEHVGIIELTNGESKVLLVPEFQGRVMTSTCTGDSGLSFGWVNYDLIASHTILEHMNGFGGEERLWLGPEGGQYSIFFKQGVPFDFENWFTPKEIDTESFNLISHDSNNAQFEKSFDLPNRAGTTFAINIHRSVRLLQADEIKSRLHVSLDGIAAVSYESSNTLTNTGTNNWRKESGLLSIWMLGMMTPSPEVTVVIPIKSGDESLLGEQINTNYFGPIAQDRLQIKDSVIYFKADGKARGKIGIPPLRTKRFMGSYDAKNNCLTVLECEPATTRDYVNSSWEEQTYPYGGDALNAYNDGPLEDGSQMGPFYELEASSPAAALLAGDSLVHSQTTYHFYGEKEKLDRVALKTLGVSTSQIMNGLK